MSTRRCGLTLTTVLAVAIGAAGCQKSAASAGAVPVVTDRVARGDTPITLTGLGQVRAYNTAVARAQVGGQIVKVEFVEGQPVKQGDPLAQIDPRPFEAVVAQDEAAIARDMLTLTNAQDELERYLRVGTGLISQPQLQMQRNQVAQLKATVAADQAAAQRDRLQVEFASVRSPISGVTGLRLIDVGNLVGPGDPQGLVTISQIQPITTLFTLPRRDLAALRAAMLTAGETGLEVDVYPEGDESRRLDVGRLALINNQVNPGAGTITLKATSPNAQKQLWPGEAVEARLVLTRRADGLTVPSSAVQRGAGGAYAWVVTSDQTVARRPIRVGETLGPRTVVESGLNAGEEVVAENQAALSPGARIARVSRPPTRPGARPVNWLEP
jgi:multidrug efflux system membrane fusion protein